MVYMLFLRDFTRAYKQTILGPLRHIVPPLFSTVVFTFVFGIFAANAYIFSTVYFHRLATVIAAIFSALLKLFIQFALLIEGFSRGVRAA
ncbi:MAG: hypothetical protein LBT01_00875 [Spirochaetaceae bacterium]|nr:hypothetical protein [Spirochaetaceae bacterium]